MNSLDLALPVALAASTLLLGACSGTDTASTAVPTGTRASDTPTTPERGQPVDITLIPDGTPLDPATYVVPFLAGTGPMRALVDVPAGYVAWSSQGGSVISSGNGDAAFWGTVSKVRPDPCRGGRSTGVGPGVTDLVAALVAQRHMSTSRPTPVTVGGRHGTFVRSTAPADLDHCRDQSVHLYTAGGPWLQSDVPATTFRAWILDVHGQRVVAGTRTYPGSEDTDALVRMIESARFVPVDRR